MALTGFLVNQGHSTICAPDAAAAAVAIGGMTSIINGAEPFLCNFYPVTFTEPNIFNVPIECHSLVGIKEYLHVHPMHLSRCDPEADSSIHSVMFADGMAIGWGVVGAMVAALVVIHLKQAFFTR